MVAEELEEQPGVRVRLTLRWVAVPPLGAGLQAWSPDIADTVLTRRKEAPKVEGWLKPKTIWERLSGVEGDE
jgi:hypothetical protein